jgi:glycosyltransferase involved in cell wall biosynthesis
VVENTSAHPDPAAPVVSLCIPTFNRARYLRCLLPLLVEELATFPHRCEVVVSDNASTDDTPAVLSEFADRLPLRVIRHETNQGAYANVRHVLGQGRGEFLVYLADDDMLAFEELAALITRLKSNPGIVAAYAPWIIHDLVDNRTRCCSVPGRSTCRSRDISRARRGPRSAWKRWKPPGTATAAAWNSFLGGPWANWRRRTTRRCSRGSTR